MDCISTTIEGRQTHTSVSQSVSQSDTRVFGQQVKTVTTFSSGFSSSWGASVGLGLRSMGTAQTPAHTDRSSSSQAALRLILLG